MINANSKTLNRKDRNDKSVERKTENAINDKRKNDNLEISQNIRSCERFIITINIYLHIQNKLVTIYRS